MNKTLVKAVASVVIVLLISSGQGLAQENVLPAQENNNELNLTPVRVRYEITDDLADTTPDIILTGVDVYDVDFNNPYVEIYAIDGTLTRDRVELLDQEGRLLAVTLFNFVVNDVLVFSDENTIREAVLNNFAISSLPNDTLWLEIYNAIDQHPLFGESVALVEGLDELPYLPEMAGFDMFFSLTTEISNDLVEIYLR